MGLTGCGEGFLCARDPDDESLRGFCIRRDARNEELPDRVPRYKLCALDKEVLQNVHGLAIGPHAPRLAYLSTMGAIDAKDEPTLSRHAKVETLLVMVHGSGRNADDYICSTHAATPSPETTLIVTPWFVAPEDLPVNLTGDAPHEPLVWAEEGPIYHTWRYGADAMNAPVSSYQAVDALLEYTIGSFVQFPKLRRIIVAGHSAGGQLTQRWALLTSHQAFHSRVHVRVVVANPKSYGYLNAQRFINGSLRSPTEEQIANCPTYNEWQWGLDGGDFLPTPYKDRAIEAVHEVGAIIERYALRDVVYLVGEMDVLPNGDCEARMQGSYRRERSAHFFASLKAVYGRQVHHRLVVAGVHHDHALMFQSPEGQVALFGTMSHNCTTS